MGIRCCENYEMTAEVVTFCISFILEQQLEHPKLFPISEFAAQLMHVTIAVSM